MCAGAPLSSAGATRALFGAAAADPELDGYVGELIAGVGRQIRRLLEICRERGWLRDDISFDEVYRFRSKARKAAPEELAKGEAFVDAMFKLNDAYLPDADQMPWFDYDTKMISSPLGKGAFAGVYAVEVTQ